MCWTSTLIITARPSLGRRRRCWPSTSMNWRIRAGRQAVAQLHKTYASTCGENAYAAIEPTRRVVRCRARGWHPIFYTTQDTRPDSLPSRATATKRQKVPRDPSLYAIEVRVQAAAGRRRDHEAARLGFYGTPLMAHLTQLGIQTVIVCGESTLGCVRASSVDAYSDGFHVVVVEEWCFDRACCRTRSICSTCTTSTPT